MDELLKNKVSELIKKVQQDPSLLQKILSNPKSVIKEVAEIDVPEEQINLVVSALQSGKLNIEGVDLSDGIDMNDTSLERVYSLCLCYKLSVVCFCISGVAQDCSRAIFLT